MGLTRTAVLVTVGTTSIIVLVETALLSFSVSPSIRRIIVPITVTAPLGVLTARGEHEILPQLTAALVDASGASGNVAFTSMIGGTVHVLPVDRIFAGGKNRPVVMVELKLPNIGLASIESRAAFIEVATEVVDRLTVTQHQAEDTWINILNAEDGAWGVGGRALTGDALIAAMTGTA
jgi:hypothetical protein